MYLLAANALHAHEMPSAFPTAVTDVFTTRCKTDDEAEAEAEAAGGDPSDPSSPSGSGLADREDLPAPPAPPLPPPKPLDDPEELLLSPGPGLGDGNDAAPREAAAAASGSPPLCFWCISAEKERQERRREGGRSEQDQGTSTASAGKTGCTLQKISQHSPRGIDLDHLWV